MAAQLSFPISDPSQVGEARRAAARLAAELGFGEVEGGRVALVVTELGTNLVRHATGGRILLAARTAAARKWIEVLSIDDGPGIADIDRSLEDGFSTAGTSGTGMGAVRRLGDEFSIFSLPGKGTVCVVRVASRSPRGSGRAWGGGRAIGTARAGSAGLEIGEGPSAIEPQFAVGAVCLPIPVETACGDGWSFHCEGSRARLVVADGLGHGPEAEVAANAALRVFDSAPQHGPSRVLEQMHSALRTTRGAAVAVAELDADAGTLLFAGAGNVAGRLISGVEDRSLLSQHGTIGLQIRRLQDTRYAWSEHSILVVHSDGIRSRWNLEEVPGLLRCDPSVVAGWLYRDNFRGRDDATVVVVRKA